jgi:hypothetical protein
MKTKRLVLASAVFLACIFSSAAYSQTVPGGGTECPIAYSVKRNNGNNPKVCNGNPEIRVTFLQMPAPDAIPSLTSIEYLGQPLSKISLPANGTIVNTGRGYISYCVSSTSKTVENPLDKIPPATKLVLELTASNGVICRTENLN